MQALRCFSVREQLYFLEAALSRARERSCAGVRRSWGLPEFLVPMIEAD